MQPFYFYTQQAEKDEIFDYILSSIERESFQIIFKKKKLFVPHSMWIKSHQRHEIDENNCRRK